MKLGAKYCFSKMMFRGQMVCLEQFHGRPCLFPTRQCELKGNMVVKLGEEFVVPE